MRACERRREKAEARVRDLETHVAVLQRRLEVAALSGGLEGGRPAVVEQGQEIPDIYTARDPIDSFIRQYLNEHPGYPVSVRKLAPNYYSFGDRGRVHVAQRGEHFVVRVGGGWKSLSTFMDERTLYLGSRIN